MRLGFLYTAKLSTESFKCLNLFYVEREMIQGYPDTPITIRHQQTGALRLMTLEEHVKKTGGMSHVFA